MADDPYSRSYWRFRDEYPDVYADDAAYALWHRLLVLADMAWPAWASLPYGIKPKPLRVLVDAELVAVQPDARFKVRGIDKHRTARQEKARNAAAMRWQSASNAQPMPRRDETRRDETRRGSARDKKALERIGEMLAKRTEPTT